ncbi:MAG: LysE family transporter, partial [Geminicoccaceae bacterium]
MLGPAGEGFLLGLSLIVAIGAQNAFVLRQGLLRQHVFVVCLICALSDALLIAAGIAGFGVLVEQQPLLPRVMTWLGAAFLLWYGFGRFRAALQPSG